MGGGLRALAAARSLGPALRLRVGRRRLPAGTHGTAGRLHAGADRRHAGGQEGAAWLPGRRPGKRAELARTAGRFEGSWPDDRAGTGHRRRCARLLEGARGGIADDPAPALHRAQDRQRARQAAQVRAARSQNGPAPDLGGAGPRDGRDGDRDIAEKYGAKYDKAVTCLTKDRDKLLTFYDFPAEHWDHLRTSNPIESVAPLSVTAPSAPKARCRKPPPG